MRRWSVSTELAEAGVEEDAASHSAILTVDAVHTVAGLELLAQEESCHLDA